MRCSQCGQTLDEGTRRCVRCGADLSAPARRADIARSLVLAIVATVLVALLIFVVLHWHAAQMLNP